MQFLNLEHEKRYKKYAIDMMIPKDDTERLALFYCLTVSEDICKAIAKVYDYRFGEIVLYKNDDPEYDEFTICPDYGVPEKALIRLAYNLYNSYTDARTTPHALYADNPLIIDVLKPALELLYGAFL
jgi:hypothetical protein